MPLARLVTLLVWSAGVAVLVGLTVWYGADLVGQAMLSAGWATLLVLMIRIVAVSAEGAGWWVLFPAEIRPSLRLCVMLRFVREATSAMLPVPQVGGDVIGARCLALKGVRGTVAAASVIVDVLLQGATQLVFTLVGLMLLLALVGNELVAWPVAIGLGLAILALGVFYLAQGEHGRQALRRILELMARGRDWRLFGAFDELFVRLDAFYRNRNGIACSSVWHLAVWFVGALEVWVVLNFMGYPITFAQAVIIESLMHAVRGAAFAVPGAFGAQEGGLIVLCAIFGVPPEAAIALSLVKRIPDLVIGVPGIVSWQVMEGLRFGRPRAGDRNERA
jgi:putative membrane protein